MQNKKAPISPAELDSLSDAALGRGIQGDAAALSKLAAAAKHPSHRKALRSPARRGGFRSLLQSDAPKVRKNAARLLGEMGDGQDVPALRAAIGKEDTLFVLPSLLLALGRCGSEEEIPFLEVLQGEWQSREETPENAKHRQEILLAISTALAALRPVVDSRFLGLPSLPLALLAPGGCGPLLAGECKDKDIPLAKTEGDACLTQTMDYGDAFAARCFTEALIPLGGTPLPPKADNAEALAAWAKDAARALQTPLIPIVSAYQPQPIPYRLELRGLAHARRGPLARALATALDAAPFERALAEHSAQLQNNPSHYVFELRLTLEASRTAAAARLYLPPDPRYAYREKSLPASIQPSAAACLMAFAQPHTKENARVIDPCCGSGTLLVERALLSPGTKSIAEGIGVDKFPQAVAAARQNASAAARLFGKEILPIEIIGGDLRSFRPNAPFDELYANLPFGVRVGDGDEAERLYASLISRLDEYLLPTGFALLYTTRRASVERHAKRHGWKITDALRLDAGGLAPWGLLLRRA